MTTSTNQKTPFEGVSATPQPLSVKDDRSMATMAHFGGVVGCVPSAIIYATLRSRGRFTAQEAREALNFTLIPSVVIVACVALSVLPGIGWLFGLFAAIVWVYLAVSSLVAGIRVNRGNPYQYRFNTRALDWVSRRRAR
ncbi:MULTISPECIES: DUF4870 domain-containing protein [Micrococcales]|uniref:DUF4870 domain-containing protein n=1 Tax=Micrococcales TaxID=85006 RepID=UPI0004AB1A5D|nr:MULTISPECIES: DUF4870 domain-containing protein [Micrococcales]